MTSRESIDQPDHPRPETVKWRDVRDYLSLTKDTYPDLEEDPGLLILCALAAEPDSEGRKAGGSHSLTIANLRATRQSDLTQDALLQQLLGNMPGVEKIDASTPHHDAAYYCVAATTAEGVKQLMFTRSKVPDIDPSLDPRIIYCFSSSVSAPLT